MNETTGQKQLRKHILKLFAERTEIQTKKTTSKLKKAC